MTDTESTKSQVANGLWYLVPLVVASLVPLVTLPIYIRALTPEDFGVWALAVVYGTFASEVANLGLTNGFQRNFFQSSERLDRAALLYSILAVVAVGTVTVAAGTWFFRASLAAAITGNPTHGGLLFVAFCASAVGSIKTYYLLYFRSTQQAKQHARYSIDETILGAVASVVLVVWMEWGPLGLVAGQLVAATFILGLAARRVACELAPAWAWPVLRDALAISLPMTPRIILGVVGKSVDKVLLAQLSTMGSVGVYAVGQRLAYVVFQFMNALGNVLSPALYQRMMSPSARVRASVGDYVTPFGWISAGFALSMALFAEEALRLFTSNRYPDAVPVVSLLAVSYGVMFFGKVPQLTVARKMWMHSGLSLASLICTVAFNVFAVPRWGAVGAAGSALLVTLVMTAVNLWLGQRAFVIQWNVGRLASIFGLLILGGVGAAVWSASGSDYAFRVGLKVVIAMAFLGLGYNLGYLSDAWRLVRVAVNRSMEAVRS